MLNSHSDMVRESYQSESALLPNDNLHPTHPLPPKIMILPHSTYKHGLYSLH